MKVIGNGMLAKAFRSAGVSRDRLVVFCSGVSSSQETSDIQFNREKNMLLDAVHHYQDSKIVYFSSCAAEFVDNPYYRHKRDMESCLKQTTREHLICRLPQAVGITANNTLVSHIARSVREGRLISVTRNARRNLIDVDDVVRLSLRLAEMDSMWINVTNGKMTAVEDIISLLSDLLETPAILEYQGQESGRAYEGRQLQELIGPDDSIYSDDYNRTVLAKYVMRLGADP